MPGRRFRRLLRRPRLGQGLRAVLRQPFSLILFWFVIDLTEQSLEHVILDIVQTARRTITEQLAEAEIKVLLPDVLDEFQHRRDAPSVSHTTGSSTPRMSA